MNKKKRTILGSQRTLSFESLEERRVMAGNVMTAAASGTLTATMTAGSLTITDVAGKNDTFAVTRTGSVINDSKIVITDLNAKYKSAPAGAVLSNNNHTLTMLMKSITGPLHINMGAGDDTIKISQDGTIGGNPVPVKGISVYGGSGSDNISMFGANFNWKINGAQSGIVTADLRVGDYSTNYVNFSGMEKLTGSAISFDTFVLNNTGPNLITSISGGGGASDYRDSIVLSRDVNLNLSDTTLVIKPLVAGQAAQTYNLLDINQAYLTGGNGNNYFDANRFTGTLNINGGAGNDILLGGTGNDTIAGGDGNDFVGGGPGHDILEGDAGNDILIGGLGDDYLDNNESVSVGDDLLIGGTTIYGFQKPFIDAVLAVWSNAYSYGDRITYLSNIGVGSSQQFKLNASTVQDDGIRDYLYGGPGTDWFFTRNYGLEADAIYYSGDEQVVYL